MKNFLENLKKLSYLQIVLYLLLIALDIYILGVVDLKILSAAAFVFANIFIGGLIQCLNKNKA